MATTCDELRAAYLTLLLGGGEVLIKSGSELVKYTDVTKLKAIIEEICGPITPEGSTAKRGLVLHHGRVNARGSVPNAVCGCDEVDDD